MAYTTTNQDPEKKEAGLDSTQPKQPPLSELKAQAEKAIEWNKRKTGNHTEDDMNTARMQRESDEKIDREYNSKHPFNLETPMTEKVSTGRNVEQKIAQWLKTENEKIVKSGVPDVIKVIAEKGIDFTASASRVVLPLGGAIVGLIGPALVIRALGGEPQPGLTPISYAIVEEVVMAAGLAGGTITGLLAGDFLHGTREERSWNRSKSTNKKLDGK